MIELLNGSTTFTLLIVAGPAFVTTIVYVRVLPRVTVPGAVFVIVRSVVLHVTVVCIADVLLPVFGSTTLASFSLIVAEFVRRTFCVHEAVSSALTLRAITVDAPAANVGREQVMT